MVIVHKQYDAIFNPGLARKSTSGVIYERIAFSVRCPHSMHFQSGTAPPHHAWLRGCTFAGITGKAGRSMALCCRDGKRLKPYSPITACRDLNSLYFLGVCDQQPKTPRILIQSLAKLFNAHRRLS